MSIQANINQGLSLASVLASQNPTLKSMGERNAKIKELERRAKQENKQYQAMKVGLNVPGRTSIETLEDIASFGESAVKTSKELFELDPTTQRYASLKETQGMVKEASELAEFGRKIEAAKQALAVAQEQKRNTRRKFTDYMKDEPTSLGPSFGELDPNLQKAIAKQYTSKERKSIMDRKDASNGK